MRPTTFRKTLLALAITATALPAYAAEQQIDNTPLQIDTSEQVEAIEITGSYEGEGAGLNALTLDDAGFKGKLDLNATIQLSGDDSSGFVMGATTTTAIHPDDAGDPVGDGSLTNKGAISVIGANSAAMRIGDREANITKRAFISGSLNNEGTLSATGTSASAIKVGLSAMVGKDLINAQSGKIVASGTSANGILIDRADITGKLINHGQINADGAGAAAIRVQNGANPSTGTGLLLGIENAGHLVATGADSFGLNLDGAHLTKKNATDADVLNSGQISAEGTAIRIGANISSANNFPLEIHNSGILVGGTAAVDARAAATSTGTDAITQVNLTLDNGSKVQGNLLGLTAINMLGDVQFNGSTDIEMATGGAVNIGVGADVAQLSLGQAHTNIAGDLNVTAGSSLALNVSDATDAKRAIVNITGTATLGNASQIRVNATGNDFSAGGNTYTLLQAGNLVDNGVGIDVQSSSALLNITNTIANNAITTQVSVKDAQEIASTIGKHGANANNTQALVNLAGDGILAKMPAGDAVFAAFANADETQLAALAKQLTPEANGAAAQAATSGQALVSNVTAGRTSAVRGQSSGDVSLQTGLWIQSLNSDATQGMRDGIDGYNARSRGMSLGADGKINDQITLGVAYSHLTSDISGKNGNKTNVDGHAFTMYGGVELGNAFIDGSLTYGVNDNEGKRTIAGTQARADYDSTLMGVNLTTGYTYQITPQLLAEPQLAVRYSQVNIDGYRETGSTAALIVDKQRHEAFEVGAGLRVAGSFALGKGTLEPQARVMAFHDFKAEQTSSTSTFVLGNTPFVTSGPSASRKSYEAGVGADYKLGAVTLGLNYDYVGKAGFNADTVTAKLRYDF